jgi:ABC-type nitrate/sulfonate/bicarbonate transport system substrate-binding protein/CheY-like chemotaxis protein
MAEAVKLWGVKDPNVSSQLILAEKLDFFKAEGLQVSSRLLQSGTMIPREILRARIKPLAWTQTVITTLILREQNLDVKIVAPLANISGTQQVIIQKDREIHAPRDLEGKRIGMAEGAAIFVAIRNMANDFGIDLSTVEFVNLLPLQQLEAFKAGELDAMACWEPWTTRAEEAGGLFYFSGTTSKIPGNEGPVNWLFNQSMLMTTADYIEHDQDMLCATIRALSKATRFATENVKEAARILTGPLEVSYFEARHMLENNQYLMRMDSMFRLGIFSIRKLLYDSNVITTLPDEKDLYTPALLRTVDPALVDLDLERQYEAHITIFQDVYLRQGSSIPIQPNTPLTFLLVDDSRVIRTILKNTIRHLNGKILGEAVTGREAVAQYQQLAPDVVIMDLSMPDMSGIDAIAAILKFNPAANIIVLSGNNFPETRQEVFDLGVKMFIPKPFEIEKITQAIQAILKY